MPEAIAHSTVPDSSTQGWRDQKRYLWLIGLVVPSLAFIAIGMWRLTGWGAWFWIGPVVILGVVPAIDLVAGLDRSNPPDDVIEALEKDRYYRWITYLFLPIQYAGFVGALALISGKVMTHYDLSAVDRVGIAISIGCIGGIGINTAHELGHKKEANERWLSKIALAQSFYGHFYIEHNRGHHVRVATPEDPASARMGESFYEFWPRTVGGSVRSAWTLEKKRIARRKQHPWRLSNDVLNAWLMSAVLWAAMIVLFGIVITPYLVIQAVVGFSLLEVVNYMEHYGMLRAKVGVGERERYERVDPSHSWNSNNIATNVLLYHLQRHSDHHANPTRRYQSLRDFEESPVLPTGYAGMIMLAIVPAVWRRVMDPRVLRHFDGDLTRANLSPRKRERLLAQYAGQRLDAAGGAAGEPERTSRGLAAAAAADVSTSGAARPTRRPSSEGFPDAPPAPEVGTCGFETVAALPPQPASAGAVAQPPQPASAGAVAQPPQPASADEALSWRCPGCGYTYDVVAGEEREGFAAGTAWSQIPDAWCCPDCGVRDKVDFVAVEVEPAT